MRSKQLYFNQEWEKLTQTPEHPRGGGGGSNEAPP